jgi:hypothetical protein
MAREVVAAQDARHDADDAEGAVEIEEEQHAKARLEPRPLPLPPRKPASLGYFGTTPRAVTGTGRRA